MKDGKKYWLFNEDKLNDMVRREDLQIWFENITPESTVSMIIRFIVTFKIQSICFNIEWFSYTIFAIINNEHQINF